MTKNTINYTDVKKQLVRWVNGVSGLVTIWERPDARRPQLPYATLNIQNPSQRYGQAETTHKADDTFTVSAQRAMLVNVRVYYAEKDDTEAIEMIESIQASLDQQQWQEYLRDKGVAVWTVGNVLDISTLLETGFENRLQFDVTLGILSSIDTDIGYIESTTIDGTTKHEDGSEAVTISVDVSI